MNYLGIDLETFLIEDDNPTPQPVCMTFSRNGEQAELIHWKDPWFWRYLRKFCSDSDTTLVWQNGMAFDLPCLMVHAPSQDDVRLMLHAMRESRMTDIKIRAWLGDSAEDNYRGFTRINGVLRKVSYDLGFFAERAGLPPVAKGEDTWRLRYSELFDTPCDQWPAEAANYAKLDACLNLKVFKWQQHRWGDEVLMDQFEQFRGYFALAMMASHGIPTDQDMVDVYEKELLSKRDAFEGRLIESGLIERKVIHRGKENERVEITAKQAPAQELYGKLCQEYGHQPALTETGKFSITSDTVDELGTVIGEGDEEFEMLSEAVEYKHAGQLLSRDIQVLRHERVRTRYGWTNTSRVSSSRGKTPGYANLQNQAKKGLARQCYKAPEGMVLIACDYNQAELVAVSDCCKTWFGFSKLGDLINQGKDLHNYLGSIIKGSPIEGDCLERDVAKIGNFGCWGGMGDDSLDNNLRKKGFRTVSGKKVRDAWKNAYPEHKPYFARASEIINDCGGMVEAYGGGMWRKVPRFTQAANDPFQRLVARISKRAAWYLVEAALLEELPIAPLVQVHDEFLVAVDDHPDTRHEAASAVQHLMLTAAQDYLHHTEMRAAPALMERWYKGAKPVYDAQGRLTLWRPKTTGM